MTKGQRIKLRRIELNLSQTNLADMIKVSKQTLYKYENDIITNIPSDNIEKLSIALSVSPAWIMGYSEPNSDMLSSEDIAIATAYHNAPELTKEAAANVLGVKRKEKPDSSTLRNAKDA